MRLLDYFPEAIHDILKNQYPLFLGKLYLANPLPSGSSSRPKSFFSRSQHLGEHLLSSLSVAMGYVEILKNSLQLSLEEQVTAILGSFFHDVGKLRLGFQSYLFFRNTVDIPASSIPFFFHLLPKDTWSTIDTSLLFDKVIQSYNLVENKNCLIDAITLETQLHHAKYGKSGLLQALNFRTSNLRQGVIADIIRISDWTASSGKKPQKIIESITKNFVLSKYFTLNPHQIFTKSSFAKQTQRPKVDMLVFPSWIPKILSIWIKNNLNLIQEFLTTLSSSLNPKLSLRINKGRILFHDIDDATIGLSILSLIIGGQPYFTTNFTSNHFPLRMHSSSITAVIASTIMKSISSLDFVYDRPYLLNLIASNCLIYDSPFPSFEQLSESIEKILKQPVPPEIRQPLSVYQSLSSNNQNAAVSLDFPKTMEDLFTLPLGHPLASYFFEVGLFLLTHNLIKATQLYHDLSRTWGSVMLND